jgi:multiple sugar transport system permease protein
MASLGELYYEPIAWSPDPQFESFEARQRRLYPSVSRSHSLFLVQKDMATRDWHPQWDENWTATVEYLRSLPAGFRKPCRSSWTQFLKDRYGQFKTAALNARWGTMFQSWSEVRLPVGAVPEAQSSDYRDYVSSRYSLFWTTVRGDYSAAWRSFLMKDRRIRTSGEWKTITGLSVSRVDSVPWRSAMPPNDGWATLLCQFVQAKVPGSDRIVSSPDLQFAKFLKGRYGSLSALSSAWGMTMTRWGDLVLAERLSDYLELVDQGPSIRVALTTNPYAQVLGMLSGESGALMNTLTLVVLSLVAALTVNPLAAYALSRFQLRGTQRVLLFFLATMALPGEIAMIPSFLLVRDLGLMNSFMALILPTAASGFGIFLLKGFFDSLPQELFEAATLDGAKEMTIFVRITMPLAQPILAVTALGAVLGAYGTFLGAVLYLPDVSKWPLMPRLYELTSNPNAGASYAVAMAGLVVASLPTLLIFMFAQRMIMRGIVLPSLK